MANILVVDGYMSVGLLYRQVLEARGHRVFLSINGREALLHGLCENMDMVIMEDSLCDLDTEELWAELRRTQPQIRGILTVSHTRRSRINQDLWDTIFVKTSNFNILETQIEILLHKTPITLTTQL
jgi:DNA-binding NtrC family response regulator